MSRHQAVTFTGSGGETLSGVLDLPPKAPEAYALFAHCFTGGKDYQATRRVSRALTDRGLAVLRFDFTGIGDSGGDFAHATFTSNVADIVRAADHLREHFAAPDLIIGHSLGGAAVLAATADIPEIKAVATIGAPSDPAHVSHLFEHAVGDIEATGEAEVELAGRWFRIRREFLEDLREQRQAERIARLDRPLLVLHSPDDEIVDIGNAAAIYGAARHPKSFISLDGADHLLTSPVQAKRVAQLIAAWADPYLPESFTPEID
ncbi:Bll2902 protein [Alloactinosynnema sp. L-07]|uniref:alpha/beta hydrolase family protein n=1 Tax=Alloactinosynnema sp. L-07 TaxID=1653480 RepID=UPI00065EF0D6|nr:alpha/beta fold hydrolase [Alloactinosynnema sp. L-07]CRK61791.1 Bll2902 protein [Alloactinosynnema sp. L-07]